MNRALFVVACALVGAFAGVSLHLGLGGSAEPLRALLPDGAAEGETVAGAAAGVAAAAPEPPVAAGGAGSESGDVGAGVPTSLPYSYHDGIARVAPSVVSLYATRGESILAALDRRDRPSLSQGSGVIVDGEGVVLTNLHLVDGADTINVVLSDGTLHRGTLVGSDRETDLAVVRIDASGLPAVALEGAPPLRVGDVVLAIGNPFGVGQAVTQGIVSATGRRVAGGSAWQDFVQIDAAINPGNSGGALISPYGELVGITTAVFRSGAPVAGPAAQDFAVGIGYAIPTEILARVVPEIIENGRVVRGWLGVGADELPLFPALHRRVERGAVISAVLPDSPAARAGLERHDVVTALDDRPIGSARELLLLVSALGPGSDIRLEVLRDGEPLSVSARLGERPDTARAAPR